MGARDAIRRAAGRRRADLVQVLGDRQRVPDLRAIVRQAGHADRRRQQQELLARVGVVGRDHHLVEVEPGEARQQPAAQRPRRIVLAAERQRRPSRTAFALARGRACRRWRAFGSDRWRQWTWRRPGTGRGARQSASATLQALRQTRGACSACLAQRVARVCRSDHDNVARPMMYHAYQAQADLMWPLRTLGRGCRVPLLLEPAFGEPRRRPGASARPPPARCSSSPRSPIARPAWRIDERRRRRATRSPVVEEAVGDHAVRDAAPLSQGRRAPSSRRCWSSRRCRATSRPCCATPCAPCCATTTSTSPTGTTCATCRSPPAASASTNTPSTSSTSSRRSGPGANVVAVCQPCVAALAAVALMAEDDHPAHAGEPDADGRPDRLPHQPDRGQQARDDASRSSGSRRT